MGSVSGMRERERHVLPDIRGRASNSGCKSQESLSGRSSILVLKEKQKFTSYGWAGNVAGASEKAEG